MVNGSYMTAIRSVKMVNGSVNMVIGSYKMVIGNVMALAMTISLCIFFLSFGDFFQKNSFKPFL